MFARCTFQSSPIVRRALPIRENLKAMIDSDLFVPKASKFKCYFEKDKVNSKSLSNLPQPSSSTSATTINHYGESSSNVNRCNINTFNNNDSAARVSKKRKHSSQDGAEEEVDCDEDGTISNIVCEPASASEASGSGTTTTIDCESVPVKINQYWLDLLAQSKNDNSLYKYSGLKNNIIIVGDGIKRNDHIDEAKYTELLNRLNTGEVKGFSIHISLQNYYKTLLNTDDIDSLELAARLMMLPKLHTSP
ncbi:unnamed protein product [Mucor hiemalis]